MSHASILKESYDFYIEQLTKIRANGRESKVPVVFGI